MAKAGVITTVYSPYNVNSKTVTSVPDSGVYWFQLAAGVPANTQTNIRIEGLLYPVAMVTSTNNFPDDIIVTDTIQYVNTSTQLTVSNTYSMFGTKNGVMGTSVLGYAIGQHHEYSGVLLCSVHYDIHCCLSL
jgi:hypothetical protein